MAFDGLVTRGIVNELKNIILHGKIDKIYHPEKNELLLHIHTSSHGRQKLYISCDTGHPGLYLTSETYQNPETPSSFCMLLRKHLVNGRITDIIQHEWERIIEIHFETMDEMGFNINKKLIIEVMGKHSNIILVENDSMRIIDCIKKVSFDVSRARQILPGMKYMVPPSQNKIPPDYLNNSDIDQLESASTSKYILDMIQGISPVIARQIADKEHRHIYLNKIINKISIGDITPAVYFKENDEPADFHIIELTDYNNLKHKVFSTISEMIEYYYTNRESSNRVRQPPIPPVRLYSLPHH